YGVRCADVLREPLLEFANPRTARQPAGPKCPDDLVDIRSINRRPAEGNRCRVGTMLVDGPRQIASLVSSRRWRIRASFPTRVLRPPPSHVARPPEPGVGQRHRPPRECADV